MQISLLRHLTTKPMGGCWVDQWTPPTPPQSQIIKVSGLNVLGTFSSGKQLKNGAHDRAKEILN